MKAIIVDDEARARDLLGMMLQDVCAQQIELVGFAPDLPSGVKLIHKLKPDIVFLDIEMPGYSGIEILDFFDKDDIKFHIIFTTAYPNYALDAFSVAAVDYLLKPIDAVALAKAVDKVHQVRAAKALPPPHPEASPLQDLVDKIAIPDGSSFVLVAKENILYLRADGSYTTLFLKDKSKLTTTRKLKFFEELLENNPSFFRCHRSYVVNLKYVSRYARSDGGQLLIEPDHWIPLSKERQQLFLDKMK